MPALFEWVIIYEGKKGKDGTWTKKPELVAKGETVVEDEQTAQIVAAREIPDEYMELLDSVTIAVRPF